MADRLGLNHLHISHEIFAHYQAGLAEGGHHPARAKVADLMHIMLADDPEAAWHRIAPHAAHQLNSYRQGHAQDNPGVAATPLIPDDPDSPELRGFVSVLTPEQAAKKIAEETAGLPVEHLIIWASIAACPEDLALRNIELAGELARLLA